MVNVLVIFKDNTNIITYWICGRIDINNPKYQI